MINGTAFATSQSYMKAFFSFASVLNDFFDFVAYLSMQGMDSCVHSDAQHYHHTVSLYL
jgi:hypothetical protein